MPKKDFYEEYLKQHTLDEMLRGNKADEKPTKEKEKPDTKLVTPPDTKLIVPTSSSAEAYGLLFGDDRILKYFDFNSDKIYGIMQADGVIYALAVAGEEVYVGGAYYKVSAVFSDFERKVSNWTNSLIEHNGSVLGSGGDGLLDVLRNQTLIDSKELKRRKASCIPSLALAPQGSLYALLSYKDFHHGVVEIVSGKQYSLGNELVHYSTNHHNITQALIIPYPGDDFSIVSCANLNYLDLNGEMIIRTEVGKDRNISRLELLALTGTQLEVVYSGNLLGQVIKARIDLEQKTATEKKVLVAWLSCSPTALKLVKSKSLHQKLIEKSEQHG